MEDDENSGGGYSGDYKKLIAQEDSSAHEQSVYPDQEKRQGMQTKGEWIQEHLSASIFSFLIPVIISNIERREGNLIFC